MATGQLAPLDGRAFHDRLWRVAAGAGFPQSRIFDARLGLSLSSQGVTEFATANVKDFAGLGFEKVWSPLVA